MSQDLGPLGHAKGRPVPIEVRWYYGITSVPLWILLGLLLVVPRHNRRWQAWLIVVLPLLVAGLGRLLALATGPSEALAGSFYFLTALSMAWASVWLLAPWLRAKRRVVRGVLACLVMFAVGVVAYLGFYGFTFSPAITDPWAVFWAVCCVTLVAAMMTSGRCWDNNDPRYVFMLWLALWMPVACLPCMILFAIIAAVAVGEVEALGAILCTSTAGCLVLSIGVYILNVPVMILARFSPLYDERFVALFCLPKRPDALEKLLASKQPIWADVLTTDNGTEGESPFGPTL